MKSRSHSRWQRTGDGHLCVSSCQIRHIKPTLLSGTTDLDEWFHRKEISSTHQQRSLLSDRYLAWHSAHHIVSYHDNKVGKAATTILARVSSQLLLMFVVRHLIFPHGRHSFIMYSRFISFNIFSDLGLWLQALNHRLGLLEKLLCAFVSFFDEEVVYLFESQVCSFWIAAQMG